MLRKLVVTSGSSGARRGPVAGPGGRPAVARGAAEFHERIGLLPARAAWTNGPPPR